MKWNNASECKPKQGERVLLKIKYEECPVVGYLGVGEFEACSVNMEVCCSTYCYGGSVDRGFKSEDVTHWCEIEDIPED